MRKKPLVSVLIVTDDHPPDLDEFFDALIQQTAPSETYEVILVDVSHTVDYEEAVRRVGQRKPSTLRLECFRIDKAGRAAGYNRALKESSGELVVFFGDDYIAPETLVDAHRDFHQKYTEEHRVGVGSAIFEGALRESHFAVWLEESGELYGVPFGPDMISVPENFFYIGNASVKRSFLDRAGTFDERFPYHAWDDYELGLRMSKSGMVAQYIPEAKARHHHVISLEERARVMIMAGQSAKLFEEKYPGSHPWEPLLRKPLWRYRLSSKMWRTLHWVTCSKKALIRYYRAELHRSFAVGYQRPLPV